MPGQVFLKRLRNLKIKISYDKFSWDIYNCNILISAGVLDFFTLSSMYEIPKV